MEFVGKFLLCFIFSRQTLPTSWERSMTTTNQTLFISVDEKSKLKEIFKCLCAVLHCAKI